MSKLEQDYPWHAEFLRWHTERLAIYECQPIYAELYKKARDLVIKDIRGDW